MACGRINTVPLPFDAVDVPPVTFRSLKVIGLDWVDLPRGLGTCRAGGGGGSTTPGLATGGGASTINGWPTASLAGSDEA